MHMCVCIYTARQKYLTIFKTFLYLIKQVKHLNDY